MAAPSAFTYNFSHNFQHCINPLCSCGMDIESTSHFFLHCPLLDDKRITLLNTLSKIDCKLIETNESSLTETLLVCYYHVTYEFQSESTL